MLGLDDYRMFSTAIQTQGLRRYFRDECLRDAGRGSSGCHNDSTNSGRYVHVHIHITLKS